MNRKKQIEEIFDRAFLSRDRIDFLSLTSFSADEIILAGEKVFSRKGNADRLILVEKAILYKIEKLQSALEAFRNKER